VRVRVIGVGTRRGDDAAGLAVAERLALGELPQGVQVVRCERPLDLVERLRGADAVVLVDAVRSGAAPGTLHALRPDALARAASCSTHSLGVAEALALARALGRGPQRIEIVGIEAGPLQGEELSPAVAPAVERAAAWIRRRVLALAGAAPGRE
jgi:hydrogenase maturation protease